nr:ferredoxin [Rhodococcus sp. 14-2686-1-2]
MAHQLVIDHGACAGHGLCYGAAPELLECDDQGDPTIVADPVPESLTGKARRVVENCPEHALTFQPYDGGTQSDT